MSTGRREFGAISALSANEQPAGSCDRVPEGVPALKFVPQSINGLDLKTAMAQCPFEFRKSKVFQLQLPRVQKIGGPVAELATAGERTDEAGGQPASTVRKTERMPQVVCVQNEGAAGFEDSMGFFQKFLAAAAVRDHSQGAEQTQADISRRGIDRWKFQQVGANCQKAPRAGSRGDTTARMAQHRLGKIDTNPANG